MYDDKKILHVFLENFLLKCSRSSTSKSDNKVWFLNIRVGRGRWRVSQFVCGASDDFVQVEFKMSIKLYDYYESIWYYKTFLASCLVRKVLGIFESKFMLIHKFQTKRFTLDIKIKICLRIFSISFVYMRNLLIY